MFYNYGVKIFINGEHQLLRIIVRETINDEYVYDAHNTRLIEINKELDNNATRIANPLDTLTSPSRNKLIQFLLNVKKNNLELSLEKAIFNNYVKMTQEEIDDAYSHFLDKLYHLPKTGEGVLVKDKGILNIFLDIL